LILSNSCALCRICDTNHTISAPHENSHSTNNSNAHDDDKNHPVSDSIIHSEKKNSTATKPTDTKKIVNNNKNNESLSDVVPNRESSITRAVNDSKRGMPLIPSNLLATIWNCPDTEHKAGYEQRDAHEFLQVFLDNLSKHFQVSHANLQNIMEPRSSSFSSSNPRKKYIGKLCFIRYLLLQYIM